MSDYRKKVIIPLKPGLDNYLQREAAMPCFYLTPKLDDFNQIPELQVCIAEALYDPEAVLSNPCAFKAEDIRTLRDQITSNLERAWEITGGSADQLTGMMMQISQVVVRGFFKERR